MMPFSLKLPGSTSNLGPGFDVLGLSLGIYNRVTVEEAADGVTRVCVEGEGRHRLPSDESNLFVQAASKAAERIGKQLPPVHIKAENAIPLERGLGSSSTAIAGGILAANRLLGERLGSDDILQLAAEIEGHPDNVAPCILGGLTVTSMDESGHVVFVRALAPDGLQAIVAIPDFEIKTEDARNALPDRVTHKDAVYNVGNACLVTAALLTGNLDVLSEAMEDRLHQPYRSDLIPGYHEVRAAAREAGALNVSISGAGPTLFALAASEGDRIAEAMVAAWRLHGVSAKPRVLPIDTTGAVFE